MYVIQQESKHSKLDSTYYRNSVFIFQNFQSFDIFSCFWSLSFKCEHLSGERGGGEEQVIRRAEIHHLGRRWGTEGILLQLYTTIAHFLSPPAWHCGKFLQGTITRILREEQPSEPVFFSFVNIKDELSRYQFLCWVLPDWTNFCLIGEPIIVIIFSRKINHQTVVVT